MAEAKKIQLYTDRECTVEAIPETSANCVTLSDGLDVESVLKHDLTAPTVIHEETSFKVGKGDIDVSTSVVDGETPKMVIKGQTYQNILPDPSLRNSMSNGKTMQKINEGYDSVNVIDGVGKSAILSGQTKYRDEDGDIHDSFVQIPNEGNLYKGTRDFNTTYWEFGAGASPLEPFELNPNFKQATLTSNYQHLTTPTSKQGFMFDNPNKTWTISAMFKGSQDGQTIGITLDGGRIESYQKPVTNGQWTRITWTFQGSTTLQKFRFENKSLQGTIKVAQVMVTETDHAVDWKPALQDGEHKSLELVSCKLPVLTTSNFLKVLGNEEIVNIYNSMGYSNVHAKLSENGKFILTGDGGWHSPNKVWRLEPNTTYTARIQGEVSFGAFYPNAISNRCYGSFDEGIYVKFTTDDTGDFGFLLTFTKGVEVDFNIFYGDVTSKLTEPYKTNILSTPEDLELRGIGDVCDTVDCITGELVNNYGIITIDGDFVTSTNSIIIPDAIVDWTGSDSHIKADNLPTRIYNGSDSVTTLTLALHGGRVYFRGFTGTLDELKSHFNTTPTRFQYRLAEKSIKTVDLSSFGNWEKIVLDGSEEWTKSTSNNNYFVETKISLLANRLADVENNFCHNSNLTTTKVYTTNTNIGMYLPLQGGIRIRTEEILKGQSIEEFKRQLSQNPITVWYPTTTSQANSIKEMLSFSNGHIQLSSGVGEGEYSLIPSFDYEVPTSNSYHMDLMKANTTYTMKLSTGNGSLVAHNGQSIGYMVNRTFNSGQLPINNLFYTTGWVNDLMILEGDLTSKALPYFKGIKSAFENESKIEVLSTGKNLVNLDNAVLNSNYQKVVTKIENGFNIKFTYNPNNFSGWDNAIRLRVDVKPNTNYVLSLTKIVRKDPYQGITPLPTWISGYTWVRKGDGRDGSLTEGNLTNGLPTVMKFNSRDYNYVTLDICSTPLTPAQDGDFDIVDIQIEESSSATVCEPYKSNSTKIPLLSPLRSLPNGAYDELIIDRMEKKATLVQRVGVETISNQHNMAMAESKGELARVMVGNNNVKFNSKPLSNRFKTGTANVYHTTEEGVWVGGSPNFHFTLKTSQLTTVDTNGFKKWFSNNSTMVLYELATPIITEIDLEGFPYIYKDGHIFLNSEIAPVVEINCNVNQSQQIQANNETLQRHELDILDLDNLIVSFVNAEYNLRLLKFDMEMSMMALAE